MLNLATEFIHYCMSDSNLVEWMRRVEFVLDNKPARKKCSLEFPHFIQLCHEKKAVMQQSEKEGVITLKHTAWKFWDTKSTISIAFQDLIGPRDFFPSVFYETLFSAFRARALCFHLKTARNVLGKPNAKRGISSRYTIFMVPKQIWCWLSP